MPVSAAPLAQKVEERARHDPAFAHVVNAILEASTGGPEKLALIAAREINNQRRAAVVQDFVEGSLPTPKVQALLRLGSPQAVHRLRTRGKLLGAPVGNQTWFPIWQFDEDRLRAELPRILELLGRFTSDAVAADRIMRVHREELGGRSIAEGLSRPDTTETAWRLLVGVSA